MKRFIIKGRVQRVGYRNFCYILANKMGLKGEVRNKANGSVELLINDITEKKEEKLLEKLRKGPFLAKVTEIEKKIIDGNEFKEFEVKF